MIVERLRLQAGISSSPSPPAGEYPCTSTPLRLSLQDSMVANVATAGPTIRPSTATAPAQPNAYLPAPPVAGRTALVGARIPSLIAAMIHGAAGVGPRLVQTGLPLVQSVPTWANLYDCVKHAGGDVADAFTGLPAMDEMTIATADIPHPLLAMMGGVMSLDANFRILGVHRAASNQRLHPAPESAHTREILECHRQPPETPVFVVYVYAQASSPLAPRLLMWAYMPRYRAWQ